MSNSNAKPTLDSIIDTLLAEMSKIDCGSPEYAKMADQLVKLYKAKELETTSECKKKEIDSRWFGISRETLVLVGGNLAGILAIIGHERVNVITTKALSFVMKAR